MAEVMGLMARQNPKQLFTIFITWNLSALWRRIKRLELPWAPFIKPMNREFPRDTTTEVTKHTVEYLRPTEDIDPYAPEIVALAVKLGMKEKKKLDYIKAAFDWVKNNIVFYMEVPPKGPVDTLKKGYGLCINKMSVLAALARVAGIPARFVEYKQEMGGGFMDMLAHEMLGDTGNEMLQQFQESRPTFTHGCLELLLDDVWIAVDITWTEEEEVGMDMPISQFGESPFGKWYHIVPDSITRSECITWGPIRNVMRMNVFFLRGLNDKLSERFNLIRERGRKKLEEMGRDTYIKRKKKFYVPPPRLISEN